MAKKKVYKNIWVIIGGLLILAGFILEILTGKELAVLLTVTGLYVGIVGLLSSLDTSATLERNTNIIENQTNTLEKHTNILESHTSTLEKHTTILEEHTKILTDISKSTSENTKLLTEVRDLLRK